MAEQVLKPTLRTNVFGSRAKTCVPFKAKTLIILICLFVTSLSYGEDGYQRGMAAYERGDYVAALKEFRPLAEQGNADAQLMLGRMYHESKGVSQDYIEVVKWYRKAADQEQASAQYRLGWMVLDLTRLGGYLISSQKGVPLCHQHVHLTHPS